MGTSTKLTSTRTPDARGRLDAVSWANGANAVLSGHDYTLDEMNRRTAARRQDGSRWTYSYNDRGEVTSAAKEDAAQIPEPGKQYGFAFDGLGNRVTSSVSSVHDDQTLRTTGYSANALNQYEEITHPQPGWLVLRGSANTQASVTIDNEPPTLRAGPLWHYEKSVDNSSGATRRIAEISATRPDGGLNNGPVSTTRKGATFIPPPTEVPTYDPDGNQTSDARWNYAWNGENRLILAEEKPISTTVAAGVSTPTVTTRQKLEFSYDSQGRRLTKKVYEQRTENGAPGTFVLKQSVVFLYDGWNMIAEIETTTSTRLIRSYEWGADLSGTMDGAGGVSGLLVERFHSGTTSTTVNNSQPSSTTAYAPCYDGNGNVMELVNLATGGVSARYEYGAFGETISVDGRAVVEANPIRFSTKYLDAETGIVNYELRPYQAATGRFASRDPIEERGGINLYGFVGNDPVNKWDYLGLCDFKIVVERIGSSNPVGTLSNVKAYCGSGLVWQGVGREPPDDSGKLTSTGTRPTKLRKDGAWGPYFVKPGSTGPRSEVFDYPGFSTGAYQMHTIPNGDSVYPNSTRPENWGEQGKGADGQPNGTYSRSQDSVLLSGLNKPGKGCVWLGKRFQARFFDGSAKLNMMDSRAAMDEVIKAFKACCPEKCTFDTEFKWTRSAQVPTDFFWQEFPKGLQGVQF